MRSIAFRSISKWSLVAASATVATLALLGSGVALSPTVRAAVLNCPQAQNYDRVRSDTTATFDGAQASWQLRTLSAPDWADQGHSNTTIWFGTDGDLTKTWVEVGATQGWKGTNQYRYYYAHRYKSGSSYIYWDHLVVITPVLGDYVSFRIYKSGTSFVTRVTDHTNGDVANYSVSNHAGPYDQWWIGAEYTCPETAGSKVYKTYVYDNVYRRASDGLWLDPTSGTRDTSGVPGAGVEWCSSPVTFRFWVKSPTTTGCN